jgi:hypothetical protein
MTSTYRANGRRRRYAAAAYGATRVTPPSPPRARPGQDRCPSPDPEPSHSGNRPRNTCILHPFNRPRRSLAQDTVYGDSRLTSRVSQVARPLQPGDTTLVAANAGPDRIVYVPGIPRAPFVHVPGMSECLAAREAKVSLPSARQLYYPRITSCPPSPSSGAGPLQPPDYARNARRADFVPPPPAPMVFLPYAAQTEGGRP